MGVKASAIRVKAARYAAGFDRQSEFATRCGVSKTSYNNIEKGLQFPNRDVMRYLYRAHRIDFNFIMNGDFAQLPADVQASLFPALQRANDEWDQTAS
ncbi:helix-turn-helix domain-containing protein [Pseudooceanicola sp. CBS1P-1]|uniref:Helix-turn-helix domain-containing protein n=2 Tax=Paracoccaceae TaxID=31989 RepID=A0A6L7FXE0_9RHOB|nr:helix-turn-helix domain-containing protein [Pseudooceanicola endophyticus]MXN16369.1 helix-turn-helix domain-containing protein [Pseudooceanicola albus]